MFRRGFLRSLLAGAAFPFGTLVEGANLPDPELNSEVVRYDVAIPLKPRFTPEEIASKTAITD